MLTTWNTQKKQDRFLIDSKLRFKTFTSLSWDDWCSIVFLTPCETYEPCMIHLKLAMTLKLETWLPTKWNKILQSSKMLAKSFAEPGQQLYRLQIWHGNDLQSKSAWRVGPFEVLLPRPRIWRRITSKHPKFIWLFMIQLSTFISPTPSLGGHAVPSQTKPAQATTISCVCRLVVLIDPFKQSLTRSHMSVSWPIPIVARIINKVIVKSLKKYLLYLSWPSSSSSSSSPSSSFSLCHGKVNNMITPWNSRWYFAKRNSSTNSASRCKALPQLPHYEENSKRGRGLLNVLIAPQGLKKCGKEDFWKAEKKWVWLRLFRSWSLKQHVQQTTCEVEEVV